MKSEVKEQMIFPPILLVPGVLLTRPWLPAALLLKPETQESPATTFLSPLHVQLPSPLVFKASSLCPFLYLLLVLI